MAGRREPTSACCIICVRFISIIYRNRITFPSIPADGSRRELKCPGRLLNALANAIVDGNEIFIEKVKDKKVPTMSVALAWCNNEFQRLSFCDVRGFVGNTLVKFLDGACRSKSLAKFKQVFFILVTFWRAVTIVYDRTSGTIGFMDPHPHTEGSCGAILACARFTDMKDFVAWLAREILPESSYLPTECQAFRLAVVNFDGKLAPGDRPLDYPVPSVSENGSPSYVDQGTITVKFSPKQLEHGPVHSKEESLGCVPWTVAVRSQEKLDDGKKTTLVNVSVQCFRKANIEPGFSCKADISVRLVMKRPDDPDLLTNTKDFTFDAKNREALFAAFTNIDFLNDNRAAFARKGGLFDLEVKLKVRQVNFDLYPSHDFTSGGDVVLIVDGRKFHVDKKYLAVHSPYFDALFHGEFAEQNKDEVKLSKVNPEHFMQFLQVIYPPSKNVTTDNVMGLVELADQFNAKAVLAKCQEFLCSTESDKDFSLYDKLKVADQRDLKQVKTYVMKRIRTQTEFNRISKKSAGMSQGTLEMLLRKSAALSRSHGRLLDSDEEAALKPTRHVFDESGW